MATNVEIKAKVKDIAAFRRRAEELSHSQGEVLLQEDTFFASREGD